MVARRAAAVPARLPWQLLGDPTHAMLGFDAVGVAAIHLDPHGVVCAVNRTWQQAGTDGLYCVLTVGRDIGAAAAVIGPATARLVRLVATAATGVTEQLELAVPGPRGRVTRRYRLSAGAAGAPLGGVILTCVEVSPPGDARASEPYAALHDRLTGLANRDLLLAEAGAALSFRRSQRHVLLYVDVDGLKHINSAYGHGAGDAVLAAVAIRLTSRIRSEDVAARLGGDEFAVFSRNVADATAALARAGRLHGLLSEPYDIAGQSLTVTASIGCRVSGLWAEESAASLLSDADEAMHQAKSAGRDGIALYSTEQHQRAERRSTVERALAAAMGTDQIRLAYQPQVSLRTGRVLGVEALLRWTSPTLGVVGPEEFVAVAEASRLILRLGDWVLDEACRQLARWGAAGRAPASVTVNVSPVQLTDRGFADRVAAELAAHRLSADQLCLEITETALMDHVGGVSATLRQLHALGIRLAIDDFGTGHSSLAQLRELPVQVLKLDRSFVAGLDVDVESAGIVTAVLDLAQVLALEVIAEGVETPNQARELARRGCAVVQGRQFSAPVAPTEIPALLARPFPVPADAAGRPARRRPGGLGRAAASGGTRRRW